MKKKDSSFALKDFENFHNLKCCYRRLDVEGVEKLKCYQDGRLD